MENYLLNVLQYICIIIEVYGENKQFLHVVLLIISLYLETFLGGKSYNRMNWTKRTIRERVILIVYTGLLLSKIR